MRWVLIPFSFIYGTIVWFRNLLFDFGILRQVKIAKPVISVGNLSVGGSGKTPVVCEVTNWALGRGLKPIILTRGYKSGIRRPTLVSLDSEIYFGDEPLMLKQMCPQAQVVVSPNRVLAARWALEQNLGNIFILDDGFQHRWLARDLDILVADSTESKRAHLPLPYGRGREWSCARARASAILFTKSNLSLKALETWILNWKWNARRLGQFCSDVTYLTHLATDPMAFDSIFVVTALAQPGSVLAILRLNGINKKIELMSFGDHHFFTEADARKINSQFLELSKTGTPLLVTTEKDAVKLERLRHLLPPFETLKLTLHIQEKKRFAELLDQVTF